MKEEKRNKSRVGKGKFLLFVLAPVFFLMSCNTGKWLGKDDYLLTNNVILYRALQPKQPKKNLIDNKITALPGNEIQLLAQPAEIAPKAILNYIKQKPNIKMLGLFPVHLWVYNLVDPEKMKEKRLLKNKRIDEKNQRIRTENDTIEAENKIREQKGKKDKKIKKYKSKSPRVFSNEWVQSVGEAPVLLDSTQMKKSALQIAKYLRTKGYFESRVSDSVHAAGNRAQVYYIVRPGKPYKIRSIKYDVEDTTLAGDIYADTAHSLIKRGDNYDEDVLRSQRDTIAGRLKNEGYYAFSRQFIRYEIDTSLMDRKVDITVVIQKYSYVLPVNPDSIIESTHKKYYVRNVIVQMGFNPAVPNYSPGDTVIDKGYVIVAPKGEMMFHPKNILSRVFIKQGDIYQAADANNTYKALSEMKAFRYVSIKWTQIDTTNKLDCYIELLPNTRQAIAAEIIANNTGGEWGVQGDLVYQNFNLLRGAEVLQLKMNGGFQAQAPLVVTSASKNESVGNTFVFNTINLGPEMDFTVPRTLFPFQLVDDVFDFVNLLIPHLNKDNPQTSLKVLLNYQQQPYYTRDILTGSYAYDFNAWKNDHFTVNLFELNLVYALNTQQFLQQLEEYNNYFLLNSFTDHLIPDSRVVFINNTHRLGKSGTSLFLKVSGEESGVAWQKAQDIGSFKSPFGETYSHYVKFDADLRFYFPAFNKYDKLVARLYGGWSNPMKRYGDTILPFDKSFWGGGSEDLRGWAAHTLGPGVSHNSQGVDQIGDIKVEGNLEYRLSVIKFFGIALFTDWGNVWLKNKNSSVPGGQFNLRGDSAFWKELAADVGIGLRFDFTYFVFRLDFGQPVRDPSEPVGYRSVPFTFTRTEINFGIGYPF